jgi:hypothetical protein
MKPDEIWQTVNTLWEDSWKSGGITLEQKNTDAAEAGFIEKYFHALDDQEIGGHWNYVSGNDELKAYTLKLFGTDGAMSFEQFKAASSFYGQYAMPILDEESKK